VGGGVAGFDRLSDLLEAAALALGAKLFHHPACVIEVGAAGELQAVASAIDRFDETGFAGIGLKLGAQVADVHPDGLDVVIGLVAPNLFEDQRRSHGLTVAPSLILKEVWGYEPDDDIETIRVHIRHLRTKLEPDPRKPRFIKTVYGAGYCLELPSGANLDDASRVMKEFRAERQGNLEQIA